ncbi:MAG: ATP-dependent zinc metalloprotease FtsH [Candidatus Hydrogenedentales bacterium]
MNGFLKQISLWIILLIMFVLILSHFAGVQQNKIALNSSHFEQALFDDSEPNDGKAAGNIKELTVKKLDKEQYRFEATFKEPIEGQSSIEFETDRYSDEWRNQITALGLDPDPATEDTMLRGLLLNLLPVILIIGIFWFFMFRHMQGGSNKAMSFGKSRARRATPGDRLVTFKDVAGVDEAKEELQEIIEFLRDPKKFTRLGGKIPKGVLLIGPPGSGKTLLARAVAGEANVPFFSISGSDFVEMFVGVGASRVRDLFQQGQKNAPCIIFIDEIDAVGRQRGAGLGGGHDEREQTLNQLLVEMDGFNTNEGVILMAATNRPDVLDKALLRPGRFDRQVVVANPDVTGRETILEIHIRNNGVPIEEGVDIRTIARGTPGFSGADLANLVNEAALLAARRNKDKVGIYDFEEAKDRVLMGPERKSLVISEKEKRLTAVHEAGHALVCRLHPDADPVHKVTIIPRGPSLGQTSWLPEEDRHNVSKRYCLAMIRVAMGGRAAEELVFNEFTSGAAGDLRMATNRAHAMVCEWGMSPLGPISFGTNSEVFLGRDFVKEREYSERTASQVDESIHTILEEAYHDAMELLKKHRPMLDAVTESLMEKETLEAAELDEIIIKHGGIHLLPRKQEKKRPRQIIVRPEGDLPETRGIEDMPPGDVIPGPA